MPFRFATYSSYNVLSYFLTDSCSSPSLFTFRYACALLLSLVIPFDICSARDGYSPVCTGLWVPSAMDALLLAVCPSLFSRSFLSYDGRAIDDQLTMT
jgi:hypothetical protein